MADVATYSLWVKNFVKIALSCTIIKINAFYAETEAGCQICQQNNFGKMCQMTLNKINAFLSFNQKFKMAKKYGEEMIFD